MFAAIAQGIKDRGEYRLSSRGFWRRFAVGKWRWCANLLKFEDHWSLHLLFLWIDLHSHSDELPDGEILLSWGVSYGDDAPQFYLTWGAWCKFVPMPWNYDHCRTEVMLGDGSFTPYEAYTRTDTGVTFNAEPPNRFKATYPYRYALKSGEVQERTAEVTVERRSWCWRAWSFSKFRWPLKVRTSIDVKFSDEVGEETGSWKGGCVGCGYALRDGESPEQCLRRMELERNF